MEEIKTIHADIEDKGQRLDVFLSTRLSGLTRSRIKGMIEEGRASVNGAVAKAGYKLKAADTVTVSVPETKEAAFAPEAVPLEILFEDDDVIVVNKPADMPTHPGAGRTSGTLVNALLNHTRELSTLGGNDRPGIVHRLDKDTTGILVVAKNDRSHLFLSAQFKAHTTGRRYIALVWGAVADDEGTIDIAIGRDAVHRKKISPRTKKSRTALTYYKVLKRFNQLSLVELKPRTGRTHQLRVHLASINHPVVGDQVYGRKKIPSTLPGPAGDCLKRIKRQLLHAATLAFVHPSTGLVMEFESPLPPDMQEAVEVMERCG